MSIRMIQANNTGDTMVQNLIVAIRANISALFKICEGIALLDMFSSFARLVTLQQYGMHLPSFHTAHWREQIPACTTANTHRQYDPASTPQLSPSKPPDTRSRKPSLA